VSKVTPLIFKFRDLNVVAWDLILIWGAIVLLIDMNNSFFGWDGRAVFAIEAGIIFLVDGLVRAVNANYRSSRAFKLVLGIVLLIVGIGEPLDFDRRFIGVAVLVGIAIIILLKSFQRKPDNDNRAEEKPE
jgi:hypothetical protein